MFEFPVSVFAQTAPDSYFSSVSLSLQQEVTFTATDFQ